MSRPPRLAYLSLETPRPGQASQTHIDEIIASLRECGWEVELFATRNGGVSARSSFFRRFLDYICVQFALARRIDAFDVLFVRSHFMALLVAAWARRRGVPVVHEINGKPADIGVTYPALRPFGPVFAWLYRRQYRAAARLIAVTDGLGRWARTFAGHDRVDVVSNGANTALFRPDGPSAGIAGRYVVFVGGLVPWHGVDTMLAALKDPAWPADLRLVIVGDGLERDKVERARSDPRLLSLGRQPYEAIAPILRGATAALCVIEDQDGRSASGVAPLKLFEAMACGVPVIASDLPFQADLVRRVDAGLIVPPADPSAVAAAARALAGDREQAGTLGRNGAAYVAREASWRHRGQEVNRILHGLAAPAAAAETRERFHPTL